MSSQKDGMITKQVLERYMEKEDNPQILGNPMKTSKMGSPSTSIATSTDIWQRNADQRRRNEKHELVSNVTKKGILPKTVKGNS